MNLTSRKSVNVTADWALRPGAPTWKPDGRYLYFDAGIGGSRLLFRASASAEEPVEPVDLMTRGERWLTGFSFTRDREHMAYTAGTSAAPSDVMTSATDGSAEKRLSEFGAAFGSEHVLYAPERITFPSADGTEIEGWVVLPAGYRSIATITRQSGGINT